MTTTAVFRSSSARARGRGRGGRARPQPAARVCVRSVVEAVEVDPTVPMVFLMMARRLHANIAAYAHRNDPDAWCFRLGTKTLWEITGDGEIRWIHGHPELRSDLEIILECARVRYGRLKQS